MSEFMLVVSPDGIIRSGNRALARILGCRIDELEGRDVSKLISGSWDDLAGDAKGHASAVERLLFAQQGTEIPVLISVTALRKNGRNSGDLILVLNDMTEQKQTSAILDQHIDELKRSNADLEQFAYVASHDLKAPLRAIDNLVQWIEEDTADTMSDESQDHLKMLRSRVRRLDALLDGLLQYARTGKGATPPEWVDTPAVVSEVVELLGLPASINVEIAEDLPSLATTRAPLQQVFHNLIGNAVKHHDRDSGTIRITGHDLGSHYEFAVTDDGPGISEDYHERIFQIFKTLKRRDEVEGSGIGLAVVDKLVRGFGGSIVIESRAGERGATFRFTWEKRELKTESKNAA